MSSIIEGLVRGPTTGEASSFSLGSNVFLIDLAFISDAAVRTSLHDYLSDPSNGSGWNVTFTATDTNNITGNGVGSTFDFTNLLNW